VSGPLARNEKLSVQTFASRLVHADGNPDLLQVCWSAPFERDYASIDCTLFSEADKARDRLAFLFDEETRGGISIYSLRQIYFNTVPGLGNTVLGSDFRIPSPKRGERLLLMFPSPKKFSSTVAVVAKKSAPFQQEGK
jgi:hypothetical protein